MDRTDPVRARWVLQKAGGRITATHWHRYNDCGSLSGHTRTLAAWVEDRRLSRYRKVVNLREAPNCEFILQILGLEECLRCKTKLRNQQQRLVEWQAGAR